jgi:hypothetical protein
MATKVKGTKAAAPPSQLTTWWLKEAQSRVSSTCGKGLMTDFSGYAALEEDNRTFHLNLHGLNDAQVDYITSAIVDWARDSK